MSVMYIWKKYTALNCQQQWNKTQKKNLILNYLQNFPILKKFIKLDCALFYLLKWKLLWINFASLESNTSVSFLCYKGNVKHKHKL